MKPNVATMFVDASGRSGFCRGRAGCAGGRVARRSSRSSARPQSVARVATAGWRRKASPCTAPRPTCCCAILRPMSVRASDRRIPGAQVRNIPAPEDVRARPVGAVAADSAQLSAPVAANSTGTAAPVHTAAHAPLHNFVVMSDRPRRQAGGSSACRSERRRRDHASRCCAIAGSSDGQATVTGLDLLNGGTPAVARADRLYVAAFLRIET